MYVCLAFLPFCLFVCQSNFLFCLPICPSTDSGFSSPVQLREIAYGTKPCILRTDNDSDEGDEASDEALHLEHGENLLELRISTAALSPAALELLGDGEPSTFCTYAFYTFELHSTPVVAGRQPRYGFTSKYVVTVDDGLLEYLRRGSLAVELHQAMGLEWRTVARAQLRLQQLLEQDGKIHGSVPLVGESAGATWSSSVSHHVSQSAMLRV